MDANEAIYRTKVLMFQNRINTYLRSIYSLNQELKKQQELLDANQLALKKVKEEYNEQSQ